MRAKITLWAAGFILLPLLFLNQCSKGKEFHYTCENGREFSVILLKDGEEAVLIYRHKQYRLTRTPSGSGAKYSNAQITCWLKGSDVMLEIDSEIVCRDCQTVKR